MTPAAQIQKYATQGLTAAQKYGTAFAGEAYNVSKDLAYTAGTEVYNAGTYLAGRASHYSKQKITIKQIVLVAIIGGLVYWLYTTYGSSLFSKNNSNSNENDSVIPPILSGGTATNTAKASSYDNVVNENKVLKRGVKGVNVRTLQTELNNMGQSLYVDGIFGSKTQAALMAVIGKTETTLLDFRNEVAANAGTPSATPTPPTQHSGLDNSKLLKKGVNGAEVKKLQEGLNLQGENLTTDGKFGDLTKAALMRVTGRIGTPKSEITLTQWYAIQNSL